MSRRLDRLYRKRLRRLGRDHPELVHEIRRDAARYSKILSGLGGGRAHRGYAIDLHGAAPGFLARTRETFHDDPAIVAGATEAERLGVRYFVYAVAVDHGGQTIVAYAPDLAQVRVLVPEVSRMACSEIGSSKAVFWDFYLGDSPEAQAVVREIEIEAAQRMPTRGRA
jgi:hypothetical protein